MPYNQRILVALLATLPLWAACKQSKAKHDSSISEPTAPPSVEPALVDVPYLVHVRIVLAGETPVTTLQEVKPTFVNKCLACHGPGTVLDFSEFPFKGRFATPQETVAQVIQRVQSETKPMPPVPQARLDDREIGQLQDWLKAGLQTVQPPRDAPAFAQGLVLRVNYRISGATEWAEASLPWNGSGDFPGFFRQIAPGQTVDVVIAALGEDGKELATQSLQALSMPTAGNLEFSVSVDENLIRTHAVDKAAAIPGGNGSVTASAVEERSFKIHWDPATDDLTTQGALEYSVYASEQNGFDTVEHVLTTGTKVSDFASYQSLLQLTGLAPGQTYYVAVLVKDRGGNVSLYQVLQQATAADKVPPTLPVSPKVTATQLSDVGVTLSWKAATDNLTDPTKLTYQVFAAFGAGLGDAATDPVFAQTTATLSGLVPETTYFFTVVVTDDAGNKSNYTRLTVTSRAGSGSIGINAYGRQCAERLGEIKPFSCLDGKLIPIVVNGQEVPPNLTAQQAQAYSFGTGNNQMKCDKPALLGLGDQGHCVPYSRVGRLPSYRKDGSVEPNVDTIYTCRRYVTRLGPQTLQGQTFDGSELPLFEDIAMIQHNRVTGETCWYQMLKPNYASTDGRRVPPPTEAALPAGIGAFAQSATQFWLSPQSAADKKCFRCHDADPWMHSPYIDQVRDDDGKPFVPAGGFDSPRSGRYSMLGSRAFYKWEKSFAIASTVTTDTNGVSCTSCHNVGNLNGCISWSKQAAGQQLGPNLSSAGQDFALKYWMPPAGGVHSLAEWQTSGFKRAAERLADCCANPTAVGCSKTPIMTPPPPFSAP